MEPRTLLAMPTLWTSHGPGGGGSFFAAAMKDDNLWIASDMSGIYRSANLGQTWQMQNFHAVSNVGGIKGGTASQVTFTSDPNVLYIPNSSLGVAKSTNAGATWTKLTGWTNGTAYWLAADLASTQKVLVANANNLYISTNGGSTFTSAYTSTQLYVAGALFDGTNVYVGTNKGLLVSTNGGASFALHAQQLPAGQFMISFSGAKTGTTTRLLAITSTTNPNATNSNGTSARSYSYSKLWRLDVGGTWVDKSAAVAAVASGEVPKFVGMARDNISTAFLGGADAAGRPQVLKTTNGGDTFGDVFFTRTVDGGGIPNKNTITGYSGQGGDFDWSWGGTPWTFVVSPTDPNRAMMGNSGFIHITTDGGATWRQAYLNPADQNPAGVATPQHKAYRGVGVEDTSVHYFTWTSPTNIMAAYTDTTGWRSTDGGNSWAYPTWNGVADNTVYKTEVAPDGKLYGAASNVHDMYQSNYLLDSKTNPSFQNGRVIVSSDQGATWSLIHEFGKPVVWIQSDPNNANRMYAMVVDGIGSASGGVDGGVWVTNNLSAGAASTWTKLPNPPRTEGHPYYLRILTDGTLVATFSGRRALVGGVEQFTQSSGVFVSTDNGQTWLDRSHANMRWYTKGITIDPTDPAQNTWYAAVANGWSGTGNDLGDVYRTTNRGVTWTKMGLQAVFPGAISLSVNSVTINPTTREMYVATEIRGVQYAPDVQASGFAASHFSDVTSLPFSWIERVFVNPYNASDIWVASFGGGIWRGGAAPSGLLASASSSTQVTLNWTDNSGNESAFEIDRATNSTFTTGLVTTTAPSNATSAPITGLSAGTTYYFRVRAVNGANKSSDSSTVSATTPAGDVTPPSVVSINRVTPTLNGSASVQFNVTFSEAVTGVDATDFTLASSGITGASISGVAATPAFSYVVTVNTGAGDGTLGLNLVDNDTIADAAGNKLGGPGEGNGNFTGQAYTINKTNPVFTGGAGGDGFFLRRNGTLAEIFNAVTAIGTPVYSTTYTNLVSVTFDTGGGDDSVVIENVNGNPIPASAGVFYDGGAGSANALTISGAAAANTKVTLTGGEINLATTTTDAAANLAVVVNTGATLAINSSQRLARLTLAGGNAHVSAGGAKVLDLGVLEIPGAASTLDLADNDMILRDMTPADAEALIAAAYNFSGWDGPTGLRTSMSAAHIGHTTLALATAEHVFGIAGADTAEWNGRTVDAADVLVKYTYAGDLNLDGLIDGADYGTIDNSVQFPGTSGYFNGDFNFDGVIDGADYGIIDNSVQFQGEPL